MNQRTEKKVVFITGASSGIGEALAQEYFRRGYRVAVCARRLERLRNLCQELGNESDCLAVECDVNNPESVGAALTQTIEKFGQIDVVIANAGYGVAGRFEKLKLEDFRQQFETNVFGVLTTVQLSLPHLKNSRGSLVLMGSANSYISEPKKTPYCMSKFAVRALADGLYWELAPQGVAVTLICPGLVESEIRKLDKSGVFHADVKDPAPAFLIMPRGRAAKHMVNAIESRKREGIITRHAKLAIFLQRHCPRALSPLFRGGKIFSRAN